MSAKTTASEPKMRLAKIIIIGIALIVFGVWFRTALRPAHKGPPINESIVPFQGDWQATGLHTSTITDITICADRRKSPYTVTVKEGSTVRHFSLGSYMVSHSEHLAGLGFWKEHPQYPSTSSIVAMDIRLEGTNLLFTLGPFTSDQPAPLDISAATLVCTRR